MASEAVAPKRFLSAHKVVDRTSLCRATLDNGVREGWFPAPVRISPNRVAWVEEVIDQWMSDKVRATEARAA